MTFWKHDAKGPWMFGCAEVKQSPLSREWGSGRMTLKSWDIRLRRDKSAAAFVEM
jgi:hypothetical protein